MSLQLFHTSGIQPSFGGCCVCKIAPAPVSAGAPVNVPAAVCCACDIGPMPVSSGRREWTISAATHNTYHCAHCLGHVSVLEMTSDESVGVSTELCASTEK